MPCGVTVLRLAFGLGAFFLFGSMSECDSVGCVISEWSERETARREGRREEVGERREE